MPLPVPLPPRAYRGPVSTRTASGAGGTEPTLARGRFDPAPETTHPGEPVLDAPAPDGPAPEPAATPTPFSEATPSAPRDGASTVTVSSGSRHFSPFAVGFSGALGVLLAVGLVQAVVQAGQVVTLVLAALFLALSLDPFVTWLQRHGLPRPAAVGVTFALLVVLVGGFVAAVAPLVVSESSQLLRVSPIYGRRIEQSELAQTLDARFGIFERINAEVESRLSSSTTIDALFGGVLGAGRAVVTGVFSILLVLVLTLYFLASLRSITGGAYRLVPSSRRETWRRIGDEAQRRVGGYVLGQLGVATLNGLLSFVLMSVLDVRYSVALAFAVGVLGLIPLVGATLGAVLACTVAALGDGSDGVVLVVWFLVYQQVENYLLLPRIMARTVAVPSTLAVVAALLGGSLLGLIGALVAIPVAATVLIVVQQVVYPRQESI